jgi:peptidoglycan hydrolase CwlO-like protein
MPDANGDYLARFERIERTLELQGRNLQSVIEIQAKQARTLETLIDLHTEQGRRLSLLMEFQAQQAETQARQAEAQAQQAETQRQLAETQARQAELQTQQGRRLDGHSDKLDRAEILMAEITDKINFIIDRDMRREGGPEASR